MIKIDAKNEELDFSGKPIQLMSEMSLVVDAFKKQSLEIEPGIKSNLEEMLFVTLCMPIFFDDLIDDEEIDLEDYMRRLYEVAREEVTNIRMEMVFDD